MQGFSFNPVETNGMRTDGYQSGGSAESLRRSFGLVLFERPPKALGLLGYPSSPEGPPFSAAGIEPRRALKLWVARREARERR